MMQAGPRNFNQDDLESLLSRSHDHRVVESSTSFLALIIQHILNLAGR